MQRDLRDLVQQMRMPQHLFVLLIIALSFILRIGYMNTHDLLVEEAYYWNYAAHLDYGYLDHPPMVAVLIKLSSIVFGTHEFALGITSLVCWLFAALFSFKLTELVAKGAGIYAVLLLSVLPFYFFQSFIMTPDQPLLACWSAALYCLYRALVLNTSRYWYAVGLCIGLGMLSKYSMVLLGPATVLYLCVVPSARFWLKRPEPYISALLALLCFSPVIYWNADHEWASFIFQGSRRLTAAFHFTLHHALGLCLLFLTPLGVWGLLQLFKKDKPEQRPLPINARRFFQIFTGFPLAVFVLFSLTHEIKFNWIGPGLLALIPWLAWMIVRELNTHSHRWLRGWRLTAASLLSAYMVFFICMVLGQPEIVDKKLLKKFIAWEDLTAQFYELAQKTESQTHQAPIFAALDLYNVASELSFYQAKLLAAAKVKKNYAVIGGDLFGFNSLMYRYWSSGVNVSGKTLILIATETGYFNVPDIDRLAVRISPVMTLWAKSPVTAVALRPYYYQLVKVK